MRKENKSEGYSLNWKALKPDWPLWVILAGLIIAGFLLYPMLPEQVPVHWNIRGGVDRYGSRAYGAFFAPLLTCGLYALMLVMPLVDPWRENYARFGGVYRLLRWSLVLFMAGIYAAATAAALGYGLDIGLLVKGGVALLFVAVGNVMGQVQPNFFVGIRTPWTMASTEVWRRTHRLAAKVWVLGGLICLVLAPVRSPAGAYVFFACVAVMGLAPMIYSYAIFRRLRN
ncbi:Uncharacterized membrane protein [Desulfofundulus australicus DSM 11792]|uniref:Uncharacterized membrane protein n=1 Tax=Desulfofundulus australicus DSM 11792 TaxID=1121425 RepID=A0A1M5DWA1_9FIRM|nr:SdpI family protein [Desulfofundulus australicus]SHF71196.1 Uncharacterized membrane protein [Desulfofundulus australicus DSM 11792]